MSKYIFTLIVAVFLLSVAKPQDPATDSSYKTLEKVTLSANKWEQKQNEVPNKIAKINLRQTLMQNPQTAADLLGTTGGVFIQKSQLGGGSPMIRGFATNWWRLYPEKPVRRWQPDDQGLCH